MDRTVNSNGTTEYSKLYDTKQLSNGIQSTSKILTKQSKAVNRSDKFSIFYANYQSICNKLNELRLILRENDFDCFVGCETWLNPKIENNICSDMFL